MIVFLSKMRSQQTCENVLEVPGKFSGFNADQITASYPDVSTFEGSDSDEDFLGFTINDMLDILLFWLIVLSKDLSK